MKIKKLVAPLIIIGLTGVTNVAHAITADFMEGQFESQMYIPQVNSIEAWEQPKTQYTPKNLRSEYQIRYSGSDTNGRNSYSYTTHFTDYDTYITENGITNDGKYYVRQNNGKAFVTGERVDLAPINNQMNNLKNQIDRNSFRINKIEDRLESGLATVSALTALHPNPRSNEKLEVSVGAGMYADNVAGAIGLFYHPNDRVMLSIGASYGGDDQFAGNFGITFGIGRKRK